MKKGKYWLRWTAVIVVSIGFIVGSDLYSSSPDAGSTMALSRKRADVIKIDILAVYGELEKAPVEFLHDVHTEALTQKYKGREEKKCLACHMLKDNSIYPKFKRIKDMDRISVMNIYHKACISCHGEMKVAKEISGPVECDGCHTGKDQYVSSRQPVGFDKSLHFRHSVARDNKCEQCHHEYDETNKKLFYAKGKEGTCRYCHKAEKRDNRISMRTASHLACLNCHSQIRVQKKHKETVPPLNCYGCHDLKAQQKIKKRTSIPRMNRKQPDVVLLNSLPDPPESKASESEKRVSRMDFVPFNHKAHESYNDTCRECHHESLKPCSTCHTLGATTGKGFKNKPLVDGFDADKPVLLEKAMHRKGASRSCLGCHEIKKQAEQCAGCHTPMGRNRKMQDEACLRCHSVLVDTLKQPATPEDEKTLAGSVLQTRNRLIGTYQRDDIPDNVTIKRLAKKYGAVVLPHRKIINTLFEQIKDNHLAGYFHERQGTLCQGCHHNSPASKQPPRCGHCHDSRWDAENATKPGIIGAYHQQCMGCHKKMGIEKPAGCTGCHQLKT